MQNWNVSYYNYWQILTKSTAVSIKSFYTATRVAIWCSSIVTKCVTSRVVPSRAGCSACFEIIGTSGLNCYPYTSWTTVSAITLAVTCPPCSPLVPSTVAFIPLWSTFTFYRTKWWKKQSQKPLNTPLKEEYIFMIILVFSSYLKLTKDRWTYYTQFQDIRSHNVIWFTEHLVCWSMCIWNIQVT